MNETINRLSKKIASSFSLATNQFMDLLLQLYILSTIDNMEEDTIKITLQSFSSILQWIYNGCLCDMN